MAKSCVICGKQGYMYYPFCKDHLDMKNDGKIVKCDDCGLWYIKSEGCKCKHVQPQFEVKQQSEPYCIVCGQPSNGLPQCRACYAETKAYINTLDKNTTVRKLRDYYYNLKDRIVILKGIGETKKQCNKLIAVAITANEINEDKSLIERVYKDVKALIKNKQPEKPNDIFAEEKKERDENKSRINTAQDGHIVDSDMEVRIDDILYNQFILHCYGKNIDEIPEVRRKCDWFIPICNGKGIYIEYWGMDIDKYKKDREEKEALYKKYDIPYIGIEKDDPKKDTQTFTFNLLREIRSLAEARYGFMPQWKK